ncbi:ferrous iron transporter B [Pseudomonas fluvialis]|uniref:ferrous iron transporter B n=1 Tax=Pseudomonas fluvialis TaxID=1793966 RepID=UPI00370A238A
MVKGGTSLALVRDELYATMEQAELSLEQFIVERDNGSLLQHAIEALQQVRGTLSLIELTGAEMLAQEVYQQATDIPTGAGSERDGQLSALCKALFVLRRYLENVELLRQELPEALLPTINELRQAGHLPSLPESFFFSVRLDQPRPHDGHSGAGLDAALSRRLQHMYQLGLLDYLRGNNLPASLKLMMRALQRMDAGLAGEPGRLCWIAAAALETCSDAQLLPRRSRKQLFSRLERELKHALHKPGHEISRSLLKELLYLVALGASQGDLARQVRNAFNLTPLPFTDHMLEDAYQRLSGPGQAVLRSLSAAIHEELAALKDLLDLIERGTAQPESYASLHGLLGKLAKTLDMVGLSSAGNALQAQLPVVAEWSAEQPPQPDSLHRLADAVLYVESMVASLQREQRPAVVPPGQEAQSFANHQLTEAHIVVVGEALAGLNLAKRAITSYLESSGDKLHLANVPSTLQAVRGGLWFLQQQRAAWLVGACAEYIQKQMLEAGQTPPGQLLETLADALSSLEYYLESGAVMRPETRPSVLDLAEESIKALGMAVPANA